MQPVFYMNRPDVQCDWKPVGVQCAHQRQEFVCCFCNAMVTLVRHKFIKAASVEEAFDTAEGRDGVILRPGD